MAAGSVVTIDMRPFLSLAVLVFVDCGSSEPTPTPPSTPAPSESPSTDSQPAAENAHADYDAAEALVTAGKLADARAAFAALVRKFAYSRYAKEAELRVAQLDEKLGRPEAIEEYRMWARNHQTDERARGIAVRSQTVGDTTCRTDADCTTTTKRECCECCESGPYATNRKWLSWQTAQCQAQSCSTACPRTCPPIETSATARCNAGTCELTR